MKRQRLPKVFLIVLLLSASFSFEAVYAQDQPPVHAFSECKSFEEASLLGELNHITLSIFKEKTTGSFLAEIIRDNWTELDVDGAVDAAVDAAIEDVKREEGYWSKLLSAWTSGRAEEFATRVSTKAFDSPRFQDAMDRLSQAVVDDLANEIQLIMYESASAAAGCVEEFVGTSFSQTMAISLDDQIQGWLPEMKSDYYRSDIWEILKNRWLSSSDSTTILLGMQFTRLLATRLAKGIVGKVVTRIIGKAAGSLIPVAGWVIGGGLIVWDLWEARKGSLPQIAEALKGADVKREIRVQIIEAVDTELNAALPELSQTATLSIYRQWKDFLQEFEPVLRLAEKNSRFRLIVDDSTADQVEKLTELVEIGNEVLGYEWLVRIIESGEFEEIFVLPRRSFVLLKETADPQLVLDWYELAGERIIGVAETELYKFSQAGDFKNREALLKVLDIAEPFVIREFMQFREEDRELLLHLPVTHIRWVFTVLGNEEIGWFVSYLPELSPQALEKFVEFMMKDREVLAILRGSKDLTSKFGSVLEMAVENGLFNEILNDIRAEHLEQLVELHFVANGVLTPEQLNSMIEAGHFKRILALPLSALDILKVTKDPSLVVAWDSLAGPSIERVVETGLYLYTSPDSFVGSEELHRWLALDDTEAIRMLPLLKRAHQTVLLELETDQTRSALLTLSADDLTWLAGLLHELTPKQSAPLVDYVLQDTDVVILLRSDERLLKSFPLVLDWTYDFPQFKSILKGTGVEEVAKLTDLVAIASEVLEPERQLALILSGQFETILGLSEPVFEILRATGDPALAIEWEALSGELIVQVVQAELFRYSLPGDFEDAAELERVLDLENSTAIGKLMGLDEMQRDVLLALLTEKASALLLSGLPSEDLTWLTEKYGEFSPEEFSLLADYLLHEHTLFHQLRDEAVGDALLESKDKKGALDIIVLEAKEGPSSWPKMRMLPAVTPVLAGNVPWALYWHYYSTPTLILMSLIVVLIAMVVLSVRFNRHRKTATPTNDRQDSREGRT